MLRKFPRVTTASVGKLFFRCQAILACGVWDFSPRRVSFKNRSDTGMLAIAHRSSGQMVYWHPQLLECLSDWSRLGESLKISSCLLSMTGIDIRWALARCLTISDHENAVTILPAKLEIRCMERGNHLHRREKRENDLCI